MFVLIQKILLLLSYLLHAQHSTDNMNYRHNNFRFKGVLDRMENVVHLFDRAERGTKSQVRQVSMDDIDTLKECINDQELFDKLIEDQELLEELISPLDMERVMAGEQSPLFFGSAMTNFGVQLFLDKFCDMGAKPATRLAARQEEGNTSSKKLVEMSDEGDEPIAPEYDEFTGFVFKTQANLDPKHRDRLAYVRIVSGTYQKGMKVGHSRSKLSKKYNLAQAQNLFGSDRETVDIAYPGDVIGINNPGNFAIGDTLFTGSMYLVNDVDVQNYMNILTHASLLLLHR